jgi:uncharacterized protein YkwD
MKRINKFLSILLLFTLILTIISTNIFAISVSNYKPKYGKTSTNVNFRVVASTNKGKLGTLAKNTAIKILATTGEFYIVQTANNEIGAISKNYVKTASSAPKGAKTYTMVTKVIKETSENTILRGGPGTNFAKRMTLDKNTKVTVIGYISNWYVVITNSGNIGCIRKDLLKNTSTNNSSSNTTPTPNANTSTTSNVSMSKNEQAVFDLINNARSKKGLKKLNAGVTLTKLAGLKSDDMVSKEYFSHSSPTYGDPFKMLTNNKISYKTAGENIAGNSSIEDAVNSWLKSDTHKQNILSTSYNYVGIGVTQSPIYGYIIVAMFIGQ